jgi:hypothetical protein
MEQPLIKDILPGYYKDHGLPEEGGIHDKVVEIKITNWFKLYFPNFDTRRKVILQHDLHHLTTGYNTDVKGETEISAWEIASGCRQNWAALMLNTLGLMTGLPLHPRTLWRAWKRGHYTTNLYKLGLSKNEMVNCTVDQLREKLGLNDNNRKYKGNFRLLLSFLFTLLLGGIFILTTIVFMPFIFIYSIYIWIS